MGTIKGLEKSRGLKKAGVGGSRGLKSLRTQDRKASKKTKGLADSEEGREKTNTEKDEIEKGQF